MFPQVGNDEPGAGLRSLLPGHDPATQGSPGQITLHANVVPSGQEEEVHRKDYRGIGPQDSIPPLSPVSAASRAGPPSGRVRLSIRLMETSSRNRLVIRLRVSSSLPWGIRERRVRRVPVRPRHHRGETPQPGVLPWKRIKGRGPVRVLPTAVKDGCQGHRPAGFILEGEVDEQLFETLEGRDGPVL